ncbi:hypothetical protein SEA_VERITY_27 [Gordonia phage Verity]|uniref:Uncharacterized protein n=2 Tax=Zitchvirus TaxID=2948963 RepID=A0A514DIS4_9CAUD|nr:hypothetical protein J1775_gp27 [Gordonia phage Zipp]YP_010002865.1 hypothetical protein J1776_gp27 [Gordonia phage Verity]QPO16870.1 hypothetical protein SEA_DELREY21_27 [Gordonia phage Delrey21]QXN74153.1 hypothetical protein SEA_DOCTORFROGGO_27 [Gordonia phage DoctorFroggo]QDH93181.1 hypothetical protein SEA_ZIPP_27 [Gordonia phage Zipp]QDH93513.1 hypothetical protein SEA_VERITY_27 [Gordonia phage Verity]
MTAPEAFKGCNPYALARLLVERAEHELQTARAGAPDQVVVLPTKPGIEFCSRLWAAVTTITPKPSGKSRQATVGACAAEWRVAITVGVTRCDPMVDQRHPEDLPDPVVYDSGTRDMLDDLEALRRAILGANWSIVDVDPTQVTFGPTRMIQAGAGIAVEWDVLVDTELGRMADEAVPMLPGDPRR